MHEPYSGACSLVFVALEEAADLFSRADNPTERGIMISEESAFAPLIKKVRSHLSILERQLTRIFSQWIDKVRFEHLVGKDNSDSSPRDSKSTRTRLVIEPTLFSWMRTSKRCPRRAARIFAFASSMLRSWFVASAA